MNRNTLTAAIVAMVIGVSATIGLADTKIGTVILNQGSGFSSGSGGEFQANLSYVTPPNFNVVAQAAAYAVSGDSQSASGAIFQTFCIEQGLHGRTFSPGSTYDAYLVNQTPPVTPDPWAAVTNETTALYNAFYTGALASASQTDKYSYNNSGIGRAASAGALQAAIWYAQGDDATWAAAYSSAGISSNTTAQNYAQYWYNEYQGQSSSNVQVISLRTGTNDTTLAQAQLIETTPANGGSPTPLPGSAAASLSLLGGMGLLAALRKRMNRPTQGA